MKYLALTCSSTRSILFVFLMLPAYCWCQISPSTGTIVADLMALFSSAENSAHVAPAAFGGGNTSYKQSWVKTEGLTYMQDGQEILLNGERDTSYLEILPQALKLPQDWQSFTGLELSYTNPISNTFHLQVEVIARRGKLTQSVAIRPQVSGTLGIDLAELPIIAKGRESKPMIVLRISLMGSASSIPQLALKEIKLIQYPLHKLAVADRFGQRISTEWPGKISAEQTLRKMAEEEQQILAKVERDSIYNSLGAWTAGPRFEASGFFRLEKGDTQRGLTKWWLVDPEGYPFYSLGVTGVRYKYPHSRSELTIIEGREHLFEELPDPVPPYDALYVENMFSFYGWNILRKWQSFDTWRTIVDKRMMAWGINTLGNWSDEQLLSQTQTPYTRFLFSNGAGTIRVGDSRLVDVFDPSWERYLDSAFSHITIFRDDALLIGYFVDNEQSWGKLTLLGRAQEDAALRRYWKEMIQQKYAQLPKLNEAWHTNFSDWEEIGQLVEIPQKAKNSPEAARKFDQDVVALETAYAERYFSLIHQYLTKYDPNHLYLGCRFTKRVKPDHVVQTAGKYCDVITINNYSLFPQAERMEKWHRLSGGRPILIGEHHLPLQTPQQIAPPYQNFTEAERERYFVQYEQVWASMPFAVGSHWYQWVDQPLTGRASDGENQPVGMVDITDQPHRDLIRALEVISKNIYHWHHHAP